MKSDIFYWILNMSLHGGLLCLLVLLLRRIKRLPRGFVYSLWVLPFLRLVLPLGLNSPLSIMRLLERLGTRRVRMSRSEFFSIMNSVSLAGSYDPVTYETNVLTGLMETLALVWLIVACGLVLAAAILYFCTRDELRNPEKQEGYYLSDSITAPALYGIFRPKILLPRGIAPQALPYILLHEQVHRRRGDNFFRAVAILTCCIHWFNPLCWISLKFFFEDMELSCDAAVLKKLGEPEKKTYALALLDTAQSRNLFVSAFGGAGLRLRVERVLAYRRLTVLSALAFVALFALIALVLLTN
ncbi:MAG: peptidase M56 BlaR1 [Oscillospiraceae bacterium]|nr:peptidase M56 BlaR1 [Oscillospiraceae bacterium]